MKEEREVPHRPVHIGKILPSMPNSHLCLPGKAPTLGGNFFFPGTPGIFFPGIPGAVFFLPIPLPGNGSFLPGGPANDMSQCEILKKMKISRSLILVSGRIAKGDARVR